MKPILGHFPMLIRCAALLLALAVFCFPLHAQQQKQIPAKKAAPIARTVIPEATLAQLETHTNLTYASYGERTLQLDLYRPKATTKPLPAIVCIHGGGWFKGDRSNMTQLAQALAARGYVAVSISYRLSGEAKFPAAIQDCKAAVRWLRANAAKFGIDPQAIGVTGLSAGGHLAALLATSAAVPELEGDGGNATQSSAVQAGVAMGAQSDLESDRIRELSARPNDPFYRTFLGAPQTEMPQAYALASPLHHLDENDPPLMFMTGELDDDSTHADKMRREMIELGVATGLKILPNAPHAFLGQQQNFDPAVEACDQFFTLHLKQRSHPPIESTLAESPFASGAKWTMLGGGYAGCEGAQWFGNTLYFAAHHDRLVFKWSDMSGLDVWRYDSPEATSFRPDGTGGFYVVEQSTRQLARWSLTGERVEVLAESFEGKRLNRPNDCVVKRDGTVWFTDPDFLFTQRTNELKELPGQNVFRYDPATRRLSAVITSLNKPNGIAFAPDESFLFLTDSAGSDILRFAVKPDGSLGPREVFATLKVKGLDGFAFDPEGRLWCAALDGVHVFDPAGRDLGVIKLPFKPTGIAFAAAPSKLVCITTRDAAFITARR